MCVVGFSQSKVSTISPMQASRLFASQMPEPGTSSAPNGGSGVSLLAAVDFKWLMTGHGWWVDSTRFHADPTYAATLLDLAMASPCAALQDCAARLLSQMGLPGASQLLPANGFAASGSGNL